MKRPSWDEYFMEIARATAKRSTCPRRQVGCVIVDSSRNILGTGYNGSPPGFPHCVDAGCLIGSTGKCVGTIHAEANAILHAHTILKGSILYCTDMPCLECFKLIIATGIRTIIFDKWYECQYRDAFMNKLPSDDELFIFRWDDDENTAHRYAHKYRGEDQITWNF